MLESMDQCRINWGTVQTVDGPYIYVKTRPLMILQGKLTLGEPMLKKVIRRLETDSFFDEVKTGDIISMHWGVPCEILTTLQAATLEKYTLLHLRLANQTI